MIIFQLFFSLKAQLFPIFLKLYQIFTRSCFFEFFPIHRYFDLTFLLFIYFFFAIRLIVIWTILIEIKFLIIRYFKLFSEWLITHCCTIFFKIVIFYSMLFQFFFLSLLLFNLLIVFFVFNLLLFSQALVFYSRLKYC